MYVGMIETRFLKMLLKSCHENYGDLFIKIPWYIRKVYHCIVIRAQLRKFKIKHEISKFTAKIFVIKIPRH